MFASSCFLLPVCPPAGNVAEAYQGIPYRLRDKTTRMRTSVTGWRRRVLTTANAIRGEDEDSPRV